MSMQTGRDSEGRAVSATALRVEVVYTTTEEFRLELQEKFAEIRTSDQG
eukprot:CAMPEP_0181123382 /NCGR_PEP_ID=MMETSP1071-20121207/25873_1 /TAXON_ID=35127 /ORGANISM="Thalassiosira sp., Strain NH16" /LENGTH=48 /DNA_ID= /DNA_START= /DNA_END= /DNA_ORIENTATION=